MNIGVAGVALMHREPSITQLLRTPVTLAITADLVAVAAMIRKPK